MNYDEAITYLTSKHESERLLAVRFALFAGVAVRYEVKTLHAASRGLANAVYANPEMRDLVAKVLEETAPPPLRDAFAEEVSRDQ